MQSLWRRSFATWNSTRRPVRYDHYEGVGSSTNPKFGVRWQPVREVLLRGSAGKGFRAPSLLDLFAPQTTGVTPPGLNDPLRCDATGSTLDCGTQFPITNGGNSGLTPEKSENYTAGIVLEPNNYFSAAFDYFNIKLKDTISQGIPAATILSDLGRYGSLVTRGAPTGETDPVTGALLPGPIIDIVQTNLNLGGNQSLGMGYRLKSLDTVHAVRAVSVRIKWHVP